MNDEGRNDDERNYLLNYDSNNRQEKQIFE